MKFSPYIIEALGNKCGRKIQIPADCNFLALDIESKTSVHIGATTLTRLMGFTNDEREPHAATLNAIACYVGYNNWEEMTEIADKGNSAMDKHKDELRSSSLKVGTSVKIEYPPGREITFLYLGNRRYAVTQSINSKLQVNDNVEIQNFVLHHPLFAQNVQRGTEALGEYTAGTISGISSIEIVENN